MAEDYWLAFLSWRLNGDRAGILLAVARGLSGPERAMASWIGILGNTLDRNIKDTLGDTLLGWASGNT